MKGKKLKVPFKKKEKKTNNLIPLYVSGVRRLVVVEAGSKRVEGIISLSDVFRLLLG